MDTNSESMIDGLKSGKIKMHELDALLGPKDAARIRLMFIKQQTGLKLDGITKGVLDPEKCGANIENMIGSVQLPLGIAGPIKVNGDYAKGEFYLPLATTEGALVASVNRGASAINRSGGARSVIFSDAQTRSILLVAESLEKAKGFNNWVKDNFDRLKSEGESGEPFIKIIDIEFYHVGVNVWLRVKAETTDAMGMNMVTIAGKKIGLFAERSFPGIKFLSESGNMCTDKKPSAMNLVNSRGKNVSSSVDIDEASIGEILKTDSLRIIDVNYRKNMLGSAASGSLGFNAHFANIIAAMFIATGQDAAHVVNGSLGFTTAEKSDKGVLFTVTMPDLHVGTIGGGTGLLTQRESLSLMGVAGAGNHNSKKLAEIISAAVLAGEISLLAALASKDLSNAHISHNR